MTGKDINKIFEKPFQKTKSFDMPSVLVVLFVGSMLNGSFAEKISDEDADGLGLYGSGTGADGWGL